MAARDQGPDPDHRDPTATESKERGGRLPTERRGARGRRSEALGRVLTAMRGDEARNVTSGRGPPGEATRIVAVIGRG